MDRCRSDTVRPRWELADVFRRYAGAYLDGRPVPSSHRKVIGLIARCRTAALGGHIEKCDACGYERPAYNSCRDRHCPKCQTMAKEQWLEDRRRDLLPVAYFHNVFTLPHELNPLVLVNKALLCGMLFRAVAVTLQKFAKDPRWKLTGQLGFTAVLHTWSQTLMDHFHLHCVIPGGALSTDRKCWRAVEGDFLFPTRPLSRLFRGTYLSLLKTAYRKGELRLLGRTACLRQPKAFYDLIDRLYAKDWVVDSRRPFAGPGQVLDYLGRYTHRVALTNNRIKAVENGMVTFSYKDRSDGNRAKLMTLTADEFIRRFLLHVVPSNFMRIRHFGFLANRAKKQALTVIRSILAHAPPPPPEQRVPAAEMMLRLTGIDITKCPHCTDGTLRTVGPLPRIRSGADPPGRRPRRCA